MALRDWLSGATGAKAAAEPGPFRGVRELKRGLAWRSDDGRTELRLCEKGRLTLTVDGKVAWSPLIAEPAVKLVSDGQGQVVLFGVGAKRLWAVGLPGIARAELHLQDDGNMVLYSGRRVLWSSRTQRI